MLAGSFLTLFLVPGYGVAKSFQESSSEYDYSIF